MFIALRKLSVVYGPQGLGRLLGPAVLSELLQHHRLQQHAQSWHLTSTPLDRQYHLACVAYKDASMLEDVVKGVDIGFSLTFSSLREDLFCGYLEVHGQELQQMKQTIDINIFIILEPVPMLAKLDLSIPYVQRYLMGLDDQAAESHPIIAYLQSGKSNIGLSIQYKHHIPKERHD